MLLRTAEANAMPTEDVKGPSFTSGEVGLFDQTFKPTSWMVRVKITVFGSENISISTRGYFLDLLLVWHMSFLSFPELWGKIPI